MKPPILFRSLAKAEYALAALWYDEARVGLGIEFETAVEAVYIGYDEDCVAFHTHTHLICNARVSIVANPELKVISDRTRRPIMGMVQNPWFLGNTTDLRRVRP